MKREAIAVGIGIFVILLALAVTGSAQPGYGGTCSFCHSGFPSPLTETGAYFKEIHKFNGTAVPATTASCTTCHVNPPTTNLNLTSVGQNYSNSHRYNETMLASAGLAQPACYNCHVDVNESNFAFLTGTPTYLKSGFCANCHKEKYDNWTGTMHRVMLTDNTTAKLMDLPTPPGFNWENMTYVIVGKPELRYLNGSGYLFKSYLAENQTFADLTPRQYTCGGCHTTGYNASGNQSGLPGIVGTWSEPGIACERCHGPAGNGHQVKVDVSEQLCLQCHNGSTRQGTWISSAHSPPLKAPASCLRCHSPFDYAKNRTVTGATALNVVCASCHDSHNTSDNQYRMLFSPGGFNASAMAEVKDAKNSLFNSSASRAAGKDIYDTLTTPALIYDRDESYPGPINVTGPISEVLCSKCHYEHGLAHVGGVNLTHARLVYPSLGLPPATCTDCHMAGVQKNHSFNVMDERNFPSRTCSRGNQCHVTSDQNLNESAHSVVPQVREWKESGHNNSAFGIDHNRSSCARCHSPINWNPLNSTEIIAPEDYKGVTCAICHNIHDMGDWLKKTGKPYAWYNRDAYNRTTHFRANYTMMATTTELCTNCHQNRPEYSVPGWGSRGPHGAVVPHVSTQKEMFNGSFKDSSMKFECANCHMYNKTTDPANTTEPVLPDSQKVTGHTFRMNVSGLQGETACSGCHTGEMNLSGLIDKIQAETKTKWNATNATVENAWATYNAFTGEKNSSGNMLAEAYFKLYEVSNDGSWGIHNPAKARELLNDSSRLANEAVLALGPAGAARPNITSFDPSSLTVTDNIGASRTFSITANQTVNVTWYINGTIVQDTDKSVTEASYTNTSAAPGTWNVTAVAQNANGSDMHKWDWIVKKEVTAASISGFKVKDSNRNGKWDEGEVGLPGWTIEIRGIDAMTRRFSEETTTDDSGFYEFNELPEGRYLVQEKNMQGYVPSSSPVRIVNLKKGEKSMDNNFTNWLVKDLIDELLRR
ncbi:MAG: ammonia-forming cytochrome c nitrite reductase subunit c552 [Candidatus Methanoperedens sp.]|nr:ammonia-forming cytochrome c nitrite reductase subunit c552 [Candidatus Methanoperedens sp.]